MQQAAKAMTPVKLVLKKELWDDKINPAQTHVADGIHSTKVVRPAARVELVNNRASMHSVSHKTHMQSHANTLVKSTGSQITPNNEERKSSSKEGKMDNQKKTEEELGEIAEGGGEKNRKQHLLKHPCDERRVGHLQNLAWSIQSSSATASSRSRVCV